MGEDIGSVRRRAWETRRQKYGKHGHAGSYSRGPCTACDRMMSMIVAWHAYGDLSEGQAAKATGLHRIELRRRVDEFLASRPSPTSPGAQEDRSDGKS